MKTLVIHPSDKTTDFLKEIYSNIECTVVNENISHSKLNFLIATHYRIIMLGHGVPSGLLGFNRLVINSTLVYLLRSKQCIAIWCNADQFIKNYNLKGFYTGMFISETEEADYFNIISDQSKINASNELFAKAVGKYINDDNMYDKVIEMYKNDECNVTNYNRQRLYFK